MMRNFLAIPAGDYEHFCWAVDESEFKKLMGREPFKYEKSPFYVNLYNYYDKDIANCPFKENNHIFLNVMIMSAEFENEIIVSYRIKKTIKQGLHRYDGNEDNHWFSRYNDDEDDED